METKLTCDPQQRPSSITDFELDRRWPDLLTLPTTIVPLKLVIVVGRTIPWGCRCISLIMLMMTGRMIIWLPPWRWMTQDTPTRLEWWVSTIWCGRKIPTGMECWWPLLMTTHICSGYPMVVMTRWCNKRPQSPHLSSLERIFLRILCDPSPSLFWFLWCRMGLFSFMCFLLTLQLPVRLMGSRIMLRVFFTLLLLLPIGFMGSRIVFWVFFTPLLLLSLLPIGFIGSRIVFRSFFEFLVRIARWCRCLTVPLRNLHAEEKKGALSHITWERKGKSEEKSKAESEIERLPGRNSDIHEQNVLLHYICSTNSASLFHVKCLCSTSSGIHVRNALLPHT